MTTPSTTGSPAPRTPGLDEAVAPSHLAQIDRLTWVDPEQVASIESVQMNVVRVSLRSGHTFHLRCAVTQEFDTAALVAKLGIRALRTEGQ